MPQHSAPDAEGRQSLVRGGRVGSPTSGVAGSMYDFVRRYLVSHGGGCSREDLLAALQAQDSMKERLARSRGFTALLNNMRHSGDVMLIGNTVAATSRTVRRMGARTSQ